MEKVAVTLPEVDLSAYLLTWHENSAVMVREAWWEFFFTMAGTYRFVLYSIACVIYSVYRIYA